MNILFISAVFPYPLLSGGHIRIYHLLKRLGKKHRITLFAHIRSSAEEQYIPELKKYCAAVRTFARGGVWQTRYLVRAATSKLSLLEASYDNWSLTRAISQELTHDCNLVHCEPFYVAAAVPKTRVPLVIAEHNIEYEVYHSYAQKLNRFPGLFQLMAWDIDKMRKNEQRLWQKVNRVVSVSAHDQRTIRERTQRTDIALVPNGVDPQFFAFRLPQIDIKKPRFLFVGNFSWFPNREALNELLANTWPRLRGRYPQAVMTVVGPHLSASLNHKAIKAGVEVRGWVEDIRQVYGQATLLLAPIGIAGGTKFKVLEAMASGLPVVTTPQGATGLEVRDGQHLLLASNPKEFLTQVGKIVQQRRLRESLATQARQLVEQRYGWDVLAEELSQVWEGCV